MNYTYSFTQPKITGPQLINEEVRVTSVYFRPGRHLKGFPKKMEYDGREYTFMESGLRYLIHKGQQLIEVFDMTDGERTYRLKHDDSASWTLVGIKDAQYATA
jgi:hypothetical protein